jgi:hypothetical protein
MGSGHGNKSMKHYGDIHAYEHQNMISLTSPVDMIHVYWRTQKRSAEKTVKSVCDLLVCFMTR